MELREWLIILGLVLVTIIVVDGVRRLQRQRKVPRLDQVGRGEREGSDTVADPEEAAREEEISWELPNGGARVVRQAKQTTVVPKPKLQRQEHPGPSKVFSRMAHEQGKTAPEPSQQTGNAADGSRQARPVSAEPIRAERSSPPDETPQAKGGQSSRGDEAAHDNEAAAESSQGRFNRSGMAAAFRSGSQRVSQSMQKMSSAFHRHDETEHPHHEPSLGEAPELSAGEPTSRDEPSRTPAFEPPFEPVGGAGPDAGTDEYNDDTEDDIYATYRDAPSDDVVTPHPVVEKARRHNVSAQRARETLAHADEVIVISVLARNDEGFSGTDLLNLMLACGLRYSEMGIFLRYETEDADSELQFAMVDVVKPGTFDLEAMDDFSTPGVTFLMPLPGAQDSAAAFEAMFETAMVLVRNLGGELKDENRSVMTAQTVEFARQRVQEFERRYRLHRYQAN